MRETNIDIRGGHSQVNPAATQAIQNNYYGSPIPIQDTDTPRTVVVSAKEKNLKIWIFGGKVVNLQRSVE